MAITERWVFARRAMDQVQEQNRPPILPSSESAG